MRPLSGLLKTYTAIGVALAATLAAYWADSAQSNRSQQETALRWARQISSQAEGMAFAARMKNESDPIAWAVQYLAQGMEPRIMRISKLTQAPGQGKETYELDPKTFVFSYSRVFLPETGQGVSIYIQMPYLGFLGARSRLAQDAMVILFFALTLGLVLLIQRRPAAAAQADDAALAEFREIALTGIGEAKALLRQQGYQIRDLVREAQNLAVAASKSRDSLKALRDRLHGGINQARSRQRFLKELESSAQIAEVLALNLVLEASRSGAPSAPSAEELHRLIQKMKRASSGMGQALHRLELELEPVAADADQAFHSYDEVFKSTQGMDAHIDKTRETLMGQARQIQEFNQKFATQ